jgi:hypothetical protein
MEKRNIKIVKIVMFSAIAVMASMSILYLFWNQELQYNQPTPVPKNYIPVALNTKLEIGEFIDTTNGSDPVFIHFFNSNCPCSKFNMKEFEALSKKYSGKIKFYIVVQDTEGKKYVEKYNLATPIIADDNGRLADLCGVYSTPQAVILNKDSRLYYRGNYNKARFCTKKETRFAEQALIYLLENKNLPPFSELATTSYGCKLPSDDKINLTSN